MSDFDTSQDYYKLLRLTPPVTSAVVQSAYAAVYEECKNDGAPPEFLAKLDQARKVLSDVLLRATYDKAREKLRNLINQKTAAAPGAVGAVAAPVPATPAPGPASVTVFEPASKAGIEDAERRASEFPDDLDALSWLAFQYYSAGEYPKAIDAYQRYIAGRDDDPEAHYYLARAFQRTNRLPEMVAAAQRVIQLEPKSERAKKCASMLQK